MKIVTKLLFGAWIVGTFALQPLFAQTTLIPTGATWSFLDDGSDQGTAWRSIGFNDSSWTNGPAQLGYGDGDEATVVGFGPDANNKHITTYFRHRFNLSNPASVTNLLVRLMRDDGGIVYLNDTEIFRSNMDTGSITFTNVALANVSVPAESAFFQKSIPASLLVSGSNIVAVEIHQDVGTSSDISFDLELLGNYSPAPTVAITSPTNGQTIISTTAAITANAIDPEEALAQVEFYQGTTLIGTDTNAPFNVNWSGFTTGSYTLTAVAQDATGLRGTSAPVNVTVAEPPASLIIPRGSVWKFLDNGSDQGTAWRDLNFDDISWGQGPAELGYGDTDEATVVGFGPNAAAKFPTTYFRRKFVVGDPSLYVNLQMEVTYDDGCIIWINGQEARRVRIADDAVIAFDTYIGSGADYTPVIVSADASLLVPGTNIIAVEMHQSDGASSDISMNLEMRGNLRPSVSIITPTPGEQIVGPTNVTVTVSASDPDGTVAAVEYLLNGNPAGQSTTSPFSLTLSNLADGSYVVTAQVFDNGGGTALSAPVSFSVNDPRPPSISSVFGTTNKVFIAFSKRLLETSATNRANYSISGGIIIHSATLDADLKTVTLNTSFMAVSQTNTLTVNNVADLEGTPVAPNTQVQFVVQGFQPRDIGNPAIAGSSTELGNGFNMRGGGTGIFGNSDQFHFNYEQRAGDFDLQVRVQALSLADAMSVAGLMARETLTTNSRYAGVFATPSMAGCVFQSRSAIGGATAFSGTAPVNYPFTWLRLQRSNLSNFTGYASVDGANWMQLGRVTLNLPSTIFFGFAVSSHNASQAVNVEFRDFAVASGGTFGSLNLPFEPPGPSRRTTPIAITEVMYKPASNFVLAGVTQSLDYIELYNSNPYFEDIGGYRISGDIDYVFPTGTVMQAGQVIVLAASPARIQTLYGITGVRGYSNNLPTSGTIRLRNKEDAVLLEVEYSNEHPWPVGADGTGHSMVLSRPSYGENNSKAWSISDSPGGSPGRLESYTSSALRNVVINEFLANSDSGELDYIELYNHSRQRLSLAGCGLSDDRSTNKYVFPAGTFIEAGSFLTVDQNSLNFGLSSGGETIYLWAPGRARLLDAVRYEAQAANRSSGRSPDGAGDFHPLQTLTPGQANSPIFIHNIVINEIMYDPISANNDHEYIEIYNQGTNSVDLSGWRFTSGIDFAFPGGISIGPGDYLVVARNAAQLRSKYAHLNPANSIGDYDGGLANSGERLALAMPDFSFTTNGQGQVSTNIVFVVADEVTYASSGNYWPFWTDDEGGSSLELINPRSNHRLGYNWAESDETSDAAWTTVQATGPMDHGAGAANLFEILAMGEGEYLVDNVEIFTVPSGTNLLTSANSTFDSGIGGWIPRGTHSRSTWQANGGVGNSGCLHVRAGGRGDSQANRVVCPLTAAPSGTLTIRAQVRWLKGWPEIWLRIHGNWMEAVGPLNTPPNPGTPAQANTRASTNAAPAIYQVTHGPVVPAANEAVVVTARVHDSDGLSALTLQYRIDSATPPPYSTAAMVDDGTSGDAVAGDGIYSATIQGQNAGVLVAFRVRATDNHGATSLFPKEDPTYALPFECLVRFGDLTPAGAFGTYRQWITAAHNNAWLNRPALSNERIYGTFVYGTFRAVYNMTTRWNGSPYHQFGGAPGADGHYSIDLPEDDMMLGTESFHKVHMPGNGPGDDGTQQREQIGYWLARQLGLPYNYRRNVNMIFNGARRGGTQIMMEDTETPGNDVVNSRFPDDSDGSLYKLQPWFEIDDGNARSLGFANQSWTMFNPFRTTSNNVSVYKTARYRNNFLVRAADGTANNYEPVFDLLDAMHINPANASAYFSAVDSLVDADEWMRIFAVCHAVGDWDHVGTQNAQNMYGYKPRNGKWQLMIWDLNILLDSATGAWGPGVNLVGTFTAGEVGLATFYNHPPFRRAFFRAMKELANGPMLNANVRQLPEAKYAAFLASGVTPQSPVGTFNNIESRRGPILSAVAAEDATAFSVTTNMINASSNLVTITGVAPVDMKTLTVNGVEYPLIWTSVRNWTLRLIVSAPTTDLALQGYNNKGQSLAGFNATVRVNYSGGTVDPRGAIVFTEIMYNPVIPNASFVELQNISNSSFDLSGWRINGLDYDFPRGSILAAGQLMVLVKNRPAFARAYTNSIAVFDEFDGNLDLDGETLTLFIPGGTPAQDIIVDRVRYEPGAPWPSAANGGGASLQLIDSDEDNSRVSNWSDGIGWKFFSHTGRPTTNLLLFYMTPTGGEVYLDDIYVCEGSTPEGGPNLLRNPGFEEPLTGNWNTNFNTALSQVQTTNVHSGTSALRFVSRTAGGVFASSLGQTNVPVTTGNVYTVSFWYNYGTNASSLRISMSGTATNFNGILSIRPTLATPASPSSIASDLPPYDPIWLNEVQVNNSTGTNDNFGEREPWLELFNGGSTPISLSNYYLSTSYDDLDMWQFPPGTTLNPGHRIIWLDGEAAETTATHIHTAFRLSAPTGSVVLSRLLGGTQIQIVDYLNYAGLAGNPLGADSSYGDFPDGQPFTRRVFANPFPPTPGRSNTAPPLVVFVNEWMASNTEAVRDPSEQPPGGFDDWFELYNAENFSIPLEGYILRNRNTTYRIGANVSLPARGYLLVWADNDTGRNGFNNDLHVNFNLSRTADSISLYQPDGVTLIDTVSFSNEVSNVSRGRLPDGAPNFVSFTTTYSPGRANTLSSNNPPTVAVIPNKIVTLGQTMTFQVGASDSDIPPQTLSYSLDNQPVGGGATIGAGNGLFSWTPTPAQSPSTNQITVRVTDSGSPAASATRTFTAIVRPRSRAALINGSGVASLTFDTIPGRNYRVEYTGNLVEPITWQQLGDPFTATGDSRTINDPIGGNQQRFYRIVQLD